MVPHTMKAWISDRGHIETGHMRSGFPVVDHGQRFPQAVAISSLAPYEERRHATFVMLMRLNSDAVRSPRELGQIEREAMKRGPRRMSV